MYQCVKDHSIVVTYSSSSKNYLSVFDSFYFSVFLKETSEKVHSIINEKCSIFWLVFRIVSPKIQSCVVDYWKLNNLLKNQNTIKLNHRIQNLVHNNDTTESSITSLNWPPRFVERISEDLTVEAKVWKKKNPVSQSAVNPPDSPSLNGSSGAALRHSPLRHCIRIRGLRRGWAPEHVNPRL